jgi:excisionase family DNA binding protein
MSDMEANQDENLLLICANMNKMLTQLCQNQQSFTIGTENERFNVDAASRYLGIKKGTLYNWTSKQEIGYSKVGGTIFFTKKQLDDYISAHTVRSRREIAIELKTKIACGNGNMAKPTSYKSKRSN